MIDDVQRSGTGGEFAGWLFQSLLIHTAWIAFVVWYLKIPESVLCADPDEYGTGFISIFPPCPEPRPLAGLVGILVSLVGLATGALGPVVRPMRAGAAPGCLYWAATLVIVPLLVGIATIVVIGGLAG